MELTKTSILDLVNKAGGAYYKLEDLTDSSGNAHTLTNNNSVAFDAGKYGNAADFGASNTNKYLSIASNLGITGDVVTISGWVKLKTEITSGRYFLLLTGDNTSKIFFYITYDYNAGTPQLTFNRDYNAAADVIDYVISLGTSNWYHLAMTYDGSNIYAYVNGVLVGVKASTTAGSGTAPASASTIGASNTGTFPSSAQIDDALFLHKALTPQQIAEIYNTDATTLGLANTNSLSFYASATEYVAITDATNLKPTGNFTIEGWIKKVSETGEFEIFQSGSLNSNVAGFWVNVGGTSDHKIRFFSGKNTGTVVGTDFQTVSSNASVDDGAWHHIACVYDGIKLYIYIDGILDNSIAWANNPAYAATNHVVLGARNYAGTIAAPFDGFLNDWRLFNGTAKTQAQIQADMGASTLAFTTNLTSRWLLNSSSGTTATDSVGSNNGTLTGYTSGFEGWTGDVPYPGNSINYASAAFASVNSEAMSIPAAVLNPLADYTIEFWVKVPTEITSGSWEFVHLENNTAKHVIYMMYNYNSGTPQLEFKQDKWVVVGYNTTYNISLGGAGWTHIAITMASRVMQIYVNGVAVGTPTTFVAGDYNTGNTTTNNQVVVGAGTTVGTSTLTNISNSRIQNVRLWSVARTAAQILANYKASVIGTTGLVTELRVQNQGLDQTAFVSGGNSSANNITTYTNNPVFITDVPFASYATPSNTGNFFMFM